MGGYTIEFKIINIICTYIYIYIYNFRVRTWGKTLGDISCN